tara:strand:- start:514 stop:1047 length:534 start_codon:yes stop_codon:yes gene_type:complete
LKLIILIIFIIINFFPFITRSQSIAIINIQSLIDSYKNYNLIIEEIEKSQNTYLEDFNTKENELNVLLQDIESSKLILSEEEIKNKINNYNIKINEFNILIEKFNLHYQNEIITIREYILKEIIIILEQYANDNKIDLILDATSYLIASNSLDITKVIENELNSLNLKLDYDEFKNY